jgi:drug/metabolite transporter (DMT)-like permease
MDPVSQSTLGGLLALGAALTWAGNSLLVRALHEDLNTVTINALRSVGGGVLLLAWVLGTDGTASLTAMSGRAFGLLLLSIVLAIAIGDTVFFESTRAIGVARALTVSMTYPLFAAVLAAVFLDEPVTARVALGSLLTLGGLGLIVTGRQTDGAQPGAFWWGIGAATFASVVWAVSVAFLRPALDEVDAVTAQAVRLPLAGALLWATPWAWSARQRLAESTRAARWRLAALAALTAVSSVLFVAGLKYAGVAVATVLSSTAPMFAIPLGFFLLGERLETRAIIGTAVTVAGVVALQL